MFANNRLSARFLKTIVLFCMVFFPAAFAIELYYEYNRKIDDFEERISSVRDRNINIISKALWDYDVDYILVLAEGIMNVPGVVGVKIEDERSVVLSVGNYTNGDAKNVFFDLSFEGVPEKKIIGKAYIYYDISYIYGEIVYLSYFYFLISFIFVFMQGAIVFFIFHKNVSVNLSKISNFASRLAPENLNEALELDRSGKRQIRDELSDLVDAINAHRERLLRALTGLKQRDRLWEEAEELANVGYLDEDLEDRTARWSPGLFRILGIGHGEISPTWAEYQKLVVPDDREVVDRWREGVLEGDTTESTEHSIESDATRISAGSVAPAR